MNVGVDRESRRRKDAFGGFDICAVEAESFGQLQPALNAALRAKIAVVILEPVSPLDPDAAVAEARDDNRVLDRNRALIVVAVERPRLNLSLVQLAAVQEPMKRVQVVITRRADLSERGLEFFCVCEI